MAEHLIYLAAGASRSFDGNKLLFEIGGRPMFLYGLETLAAVAEAVGIGDEYYFSHLFKQRYGVSPGAYRREFHRSE